MSASKEYRYKNLTWLQMNKAIALQTLVHPVQKKIRW